jgi:predicted amino acid-binding ACT domain protein
MVSYSGSMRRLYTGRPIPCRFPGHPPRFVAVRLACWPSAGWKCTEPPSSSAGLGQVSPPPVPNLRYWANVRAEALMDHGGNDLLRLQISMPDQTGALARVATIIASHGGNITSIDSQHATSEFAVDELLVDFASEPDLTRLREDLAGDGDTLLVSQQVTETIDPIVASLRHISELLQSGSMDAEAALARSVAELCSSPVAWVSTADEAVRYEAGRFAIERQDVVIMTTSQLPADLAERLPGEVCLLALPDVERVDRPRVVFVARPVGNDFTTTEVGRIEALISLHGAVANVISPQ